MRNLSLKKAYLFSFILSLFTLLPLSGEIPSARLLVKENALCGEGAIWHPDRNTLFWVDIDGKRLFEYNPTLKTNKQWHFNKLISTVVPESLETVIIALSDEIIRFNIKTNTKEHIASIDAAGNTLRCNDGKCDPSGRLWIGTMSLNGQKETGSLFRLEGSDVQEIIKNVTISNGIVWTKDRRTMYYIDTPTQEIVAYDFNPKTGAISNRRVVIKVPKEIGSPDGMTIDRNDMLWVAHWGGGGIYNWNPQNGKLLKKIAVPAPNVTSCAFGGENYDILFITTAKGGLSKEMQEKYPLSGSLFYYIIPDSKGVKTSKYKTVQ